MTITHTHLKGHTTTTGHIFFKLDVSYTIPIDKEHYEVLLHHNGSPRFKSLQDRLLEANLVSDVWFSAGDGDIYPPTVTICVLAANDTPDKRDSIALIIKSQIEACADEQKRWEDRD